MISRVYKIFIVLLIFCVAVYTDTSDSVSNASIDSLRRTDTCDSNQETMLKGTKNSEYLEQIVVTANRFAEKRLNSPYKVEQVDKKTIAFNDPQTSADAIAASSEVFVQKSQLGGGSPMLRGFSANSLLFVVDGIRLNNAICRSGNHHNVISIDAQSLDMVEILFGPASVMYGSDALGGVIHLETKKPSYAKKKPLHFSANAMARYSSADMEKTGHAELITGFEKVALLSSFTYSDYNDLKMGKKGDHFDDYNNDFYVLKSNSRDTFLLNNDSHIQRESGYSQINIMEKLRFKIGDVDALMNYTMSSTSNIPRYDRLIEKSDTLPKYSEWYYGPQKWTNASLDLNLDNDCQMFSKFRMLMGYQKYSESRNDRKYQSPTLRTQSETVDIASLNADFLKFIGVHQLTYGIEAVYNSTVSTAQKTNLETGMSKPDAPRYPDGNNDFATGAFYLHYTGNFSDRFLPVAGLRYSHVYLNSRIKNRQFYDFPFDHIKIQTGALSGGFGLVYKPVSMFIVSLNASTGFRAPNLDDVGKVFESEPGHVVVPNPDLKPEYAYNFDLGLKIHIKDRFQCETSGFVTYVDEVMVRGLFTFNGNDSILYNGETSRVEALVNKASATIGGVSASMKLWLTSFLSLHSNFCYTYGTDNTGEPLRHVTPVFGSTALQLLSGRFRCEVQTSYNGKISAEDLATSEKNKAHIYAKDNSGQPYSPSWLTLNTRLSYTLKNNVMINFGIDNMLDKAYRPYSSGISAPGRNFILSIRYGMENNRQAKSKTM